MFLLVLFLSHFRFMFSRIFPLAAGVRKKKRQKKEEERENNLDNDTMYFLFLFFRKFAVLQQRSRRVRAYVDLSETNSHPTTHGCDQHMYSASKALIKD